MAERSLRPIFGHPDELRYARWVVFYAIAGYLSDGLRLRRYMGGMSVTKFIAVWHLCRIKRLKGCTFYKSQTEFPPKINTTGYHGHVARSMLLRNAWDGEHQTHGIILI